MPLTLPPAKLTHYYFQAPNVPYRGAAQAQIKAEDIGEITKVELQQDTKGTSWRIRGLKINTDSATGGKGSGNGVYYVNMPPDGMLSSPPLLFCYYCHLTKSDLPLLSVEITMENPMVSGVNNIKLQKCEAQYCAREEAAFRAKTKDPNEQYWLSGE